MMVDGFTSEEEEEIAIVSKIGYFENYKSRKGHLDELEALDQKLQVYERERSTRHMNFVQKFEAEDEILVHSSKVLKEFREREESSVFPSDSHHKLHINSPPDFKDIKDDDEDDDTKQVLVESTPSEVESSAGTLLSKSSSQYSLSEQAMQQLADFQEQRFEKRRQRLAAADKRRTMELEKLKCFNNIEANTTTIMKQHTGKYNDDNDDGDDGDVCISSSNTMLEEKTKTVASFRVDILSNNDVTIEPAYKELKNFQYILSTQKEEGLVTNNVAVFFSISEKQTFGGEKGNISSTNQKGEATKSSGQLSSTDSLSVLQEAIGSVDEDIVLGDIDTELKAIDEFLNSATPK